MGVRLAQITRAATAKIVGAWTTTPTNADSAGSDQTSKVATLKVRKSTYQASDFGSADPDINKIYDVACVGSSPNTWEMQSTCRSFYNGLTRAAPRRSFTILQAKQAGTMPLLPQ